MQSGKLPHRITIEYETEGEQDQVTGYVPIIWTEFAKVWGKLEALSTKDQLQAQAINSSMTARCKIRYSSTASQINSTMRVLFRGKYWKIDGDPIPDNESGLEWLTLNLSEGESSWQQST
ncbi:phage head closure protein [Acinetobacter bohemicus]|uniref:Phage head-tail adaptor, putative, SPP1 family n=1 Tax=Acinetobacter bohemicus TaxID=1435036 RepID=A0A1I6UCK4_9GAMM|nr:phage head closure protein [Acinetobacter bohemicus]KAB0653147.1 phage head closure protein [Acinetobacter bohemicus]SFS99150.1 phage head-tail adaptor, putative, SPP1 family [Acinetobacter bohemicus]